MMIHLLDSESAELAESVIGTMGNTPTDKYVSLLALDASNYHADGMGNGATMVTLFDVDRVALTLLDAAYRSRYGPYGQYQQPTTADPAPWSDAAAAILRWDDRGFVSATYFASAPEAAAEFDALADAYSDEYDDDDDDSGSHDAG
jgi:hypothetical protein